MNKLNIISSFLKFRIKCIHPVLYYGYKCNETVTHNKTFVSIVPVQCYSTVERKLCIRKDSVHSLLYNGSLLSPTYTIDLIHQICRLKSGKSKNKKPRDEESSSDEEDEEEESNWILEKGPDFKDVKVRVSSLRLDTFIKAGFGLSRSEVEKTFYGSKVRVNGQASRKKSQMIHIGDMLELVKEDDDDTKVVARVELMKIGDIKIGAPRVYAAMNPPLAPSAEICGLILARKGSKGIPKKNISPLQGVPLVARAIRVLRKSNCFSKVWVSTDDDRVQAIAEEEAAFVHRRANHTAVDSASSLVAVQEFLQSHAEIENVCLVQCTSPFLKKEYLQEGYDLFTSSKWDSVFSVTRKHLLRWSEDTPCVPLNFDLRSRPQRQSFKGDICENGMFYFCRKKFILEGVLQGGRCQYVEVPEEDSLDINTPLDLFMAEQILNFGKRTHKYQDESHSGNSFREISL